MSPRGQFLEKLRASLDAGAFVKLTLSQYRGADAGLRNLYGRVVELREGRRMSLVWHYATRDVTRNLDFAGAVEHIGGMLGAEFERAHLFTTTGDWQLRCDERGEGRLKAARPAFTEAPCAEHDRRKPQPLGAEGALFLQKLGVANAAGEPRPGMADKLRQIQRFVELLGHLLADAGLIPKGVPCAPLSRFLKSWILIPCFFKRS